MESFFYTLAAALVSGLAVIAWTTPTFFTGVLFKIVFISCFAAQTIMQVWDIAIGFMFRRVSSAFPQISGEELLKVSQAAKISDTVWMFFWGAVLYMVILLVLAFSKASHDEKLANDKNQKSQP